MVTSPLSCTRGVISTFTPVSMYWNCVLTRGLMPTPPMPGWKLPLAVGTRSPMLSVAFTPSTERTCGACSTLVRALLRVACNRAPGRVVEKSELARCARFESGMELPVDVELVVVGVVVRAEVLAVEVLVLAVEVELELIGTWMLERGVKAMGELIPVDASAAVI